MTFDRFTRNLLARLVGNARERLKLDVMDQLRGLGFQEDGTVLDLGRIAGLSEEERAAGEELRALLDHYIALESGAESVRRRNAYDRMAREIGFTTLNRLVALRMAEERGLLVESVGKALSSQGFRVYEQVVNGALGGRHETYRAYIESLYDEVALDLPLVFDRSDPRSLIFPSEACLNDVLGLLNDPAVAHLWAEDEAIGWVYQYYNDPEERRKMRESNAPRNGRELAVRNQFFTPRYVVEFLVDNTLGRLWYEMRHGETSLAERCRYLVRRPDEVFLAERPEWETEADPDLAFLLGESETLEPFGLPAVVEHLGHEENGVLVLGWTDSGGDGLRIHRFAHRVRPFEWSEDPRNEEWKTLVRRLEQDEQVDLSKHSTQELWDLIYAYARADRFTEGLWDSVVVPMWHIASEIRRRLLAARDPNTSPEERVRGAHLVQHRSKRDPRELRILDPACGSGHFLLYCFDLLLTIYEEAWEDPDLGRRLQRTFPDRDAYRKAVPGLILSRNLYGIDIDPRACQIAGIALWLRAQRAFKEMDIAAAERPPIRRGNIVCAEPMPGERELLEEYLQTLDPRLRPLVLTVWEEMQLAGEAGSLLEIEDKIRAALAQGREEALIDSPPVKLTLFEGQSAPRQTVLTLASADDQRFWSEAERKLLDTLHAYAEQAADQAAMRRRLFAEDAAQGFAFIDVCRTRYDVILMNPPFGAASTGAKQYIDRAYPRTKNDLYAAFVERGLAMLHARGMLGAITSRTGFFLTTFQKWREEILLKEARMTTMADLGYGVLDTAMVETAAYCMENVDGR